ncbi:MAG: hypothetical protein SGBAC_000343 [Bacillariaceae sp.]
MPTMPLKSLFKRKRRNRGSSRRKELSDEYDPMMVGSEHAAQSSKKPVLDSKAQSRNRFEAAKRMFSSPSNPSEQEARETSVTPEKVSRFHPNVSRGVESGRDTSMHRSFPSASEDSDEIDIDEVNDEAPEESPGTPQRYLKATQARNDFDESWKERTLPHQRVAWTGSVVGFTKNKADFGQNQSQDNPSAQSSSLAPEDDDTAQYDEIDNRDYIIESDDESNEADESPNTAGRLEHRSNKNVMIFGDSNFGGVSSKQQESAFFQNQGKRQQSHRAPQRQTVLPRSNQERNVNSASLAASSSMESYLLRGTESDSVLFGEDLTPSASEDFFAGLDAEDTNPSEHMSTSNSLLDNSLIEETTTSIESRQPDSRGDYAPSHFQDGFVKTVRHGWNYLEQNLSVDQDDREGEFTKTVQTVREGWNYLEHSLSAKSVDSDFDDMVTSIRQSLSNMSEDLSNQIDRSLPSTTLTSRQDDLLNTVINNMSFFNEDSTDEELEQEMFGAPLENSSVPKDVATDAPKDPDEILDEVLENWSLTSDNPTSQDELQSSELASEETVDEPEDANENGFLTTVRQTLSYLTDDGDDNEDQQEKTNEVQESTNENGFMTTIRQTLSYVTDDGANDEDGNESSMSGSHSTEVKTPREEKHERRGSGGIIKSWSFLSFEPNNDDASDTSSIGTASDDEESVVYRDELSVDYSDAPSDEGDEGISTGGLSRGEGGMLDQVLDHWSYFATAAGIPDDLDDFDDYSTNSVSESDESTVADDIVTTSRMRSSPKTSCRKRGSPKSSNRKKASRRTRGRKSRSSANRRRSIPKAVFGSGDDGESSVDKDPSPSNGIVVNIPLQPLITHTTVQVSGQYVPETTNEDDVVAQEVEEPLSSDIQNPAPKIEPFDKEPLKDESSEAKNDEEGIADLVAEVTEAVVREYNHMETAMEEALAVEKEIKSSGSLVVVEPALVESEKVDEPGEYGKMSADEESIESIGCATTTENVSVQSIQDADDDSSEFFDADETSEGDKDLSEVGEKDDDDELEESARTASESSEVFGDECSYFSKSDGGSEYDSEYTGEFSDDSSSVGAIKVAYSASSMKSAALERFGQPDSKADEINTVEKVRSKKGQTGRVVDCQRSSKGSHRSREKQTDEESEASQTHRRRLV